MAENERADLTFMGYFLIGMFLLVFAILGLQDAGLFGNIFDEKGEFVATKTLPLSWIMVSVFALIISIALAVYSILMYRIGNKSATAVFMTFSAALLAYSFLSIGREIFIMLADEAGLFVSSSWFILMIFAIVFLIVAIYLFLDKVPKFLSLLMIIAGLAFFFLGLAYYYAFAGPEANEDIVKALTVIFGIFSLLGFFISSYIGLVYSAPKAKLPLI